MKTKRAGELLADVGPNFRMSYSSCSVSSEICSLRHLLCVRASRNSASRWAGSNAMGISVKADAAPQHWGCRAQRQPQARVGGAAEGRLEFHLLNRDHFGHVVAQHVL